jgi:putative tryptophan/tyrosine transport system substrate-binding protein
MRRRDFIKVIGSAVVWPFAARAQSAGLVRQVGMLMGFAESDLAAQSEVAAFRVALTKLGWMEGSNLRIDLRWGAGDASTIRSFAKELVELRPDAILGHTTPVIGAIARETQTIPIVFTVIADPIGSGFAASLARPGGNITGFSDASSVLGSKWVELLKEIAPHIVRIALLFNPATTSPVEFYMPSIQAAALSFDVQVSAAPIHTKDDIEGVIAAQARSPGGSLIVMPDAFNAANRDLIIALAARFGVPVMYNGNYYAESGGLIAYGADRIEEFRQAAGYIDRILKGAKPADLPIQQPTKFDFVINPKTAKALGLTVPDKLLALADEVIE